MRNITTLLLAALLFAAAGENSARADPIGVRAGNGVVVEMVESIPVYDIWHFLNPAHSQSSQSNSPGTSLAVWRFGSESAPRSGSWVACALILVGYGDVGEFPVAVKVWATEYQVVSVSELRAEHGETSRYQIAVGGDRVLMTIGSDGRVYVGQAAIGSVH